MTLDEIATRADIMSLERRIEALARALEGAKIVPRPEWLSIADAAQAEGVTPATIRRWIAEGRIEAKGSGKARRVRVSPAA